MNHSQMPSSRRKGIEVRSPNGRNDSERGVPTELLPRRTNASAVQSLGHSVALPSVFLGNSTNRRRPSLWHIVGCLAATALFVAGCTTTAADGPTVSSGPGSSAAVSPSVADVTTSPSSSVASSDVTTSPEPATTSTNGSGQPDSATQEANDRAAIEAQWVAFWDVYNRIVRTPSEQRHRALEPVAVDPILSEIVDAAARFDSQGLDYYGSVVQHPYWVTPVNGEAFAVMRDCQDQSQYGSVYVATNVKRSVGVDRNSLQAGFVRGDDGVWRVQNLQHLENVPC